MSFGHAAVLFVVEATLDYGREPAYAPQRADYRSAHASLGGNNLVTIRTVALVSALAALTPAATIATTTATAAVNAPAHKISHSTSTNWSGYDVTGHGPYSSVSANWTQPTANCQPTPSGDSSFWVGLDGDTTSTVEQTGTDADCSNGSPVYYGWYEMYPKYPVNFSNPVAPDDSMSASVTYQGNGTYRLVLQDSTRGWTQTVTSRSTKATRGSAEIIAEAPSTNQGVLPLADFQNVGFTSASVNGTPLSSSTSGINPITMDTSTGGIIKAQPSPLSTNGAFSITWQHQ